MKIHEIDADKNYIFIFRGMTKVDAQYIEYSINKWLRDSGKTPLVGVLLAKDTELVDIVEMEGTPKSIHISQQADICEAEGAWVGPPPGTHRADIAIVPPARPFRVDMNPLHYTISFDAGDQHDEYIVPNKEQKSWLLGLVYWMNKQWQKIVFKK